MVLVIGCAALSAFVKSKSQPVYYASPKIIIADPDFFFEKSVRLKTASMEPFVDIQGSRELRYREATDRPYRIIVRGRIPTKVPDDLLCYCEGTKDGVTVLSCR